MLYQYYIIFKDRFKSNTFFHRQDVLLLSLHTLLITLSTLIAKHFTRDLTKAKQNCFEHSIQFSVILPSNLRYLARQVLARTSNFLAFIFTVLSAGIKKRYRYWWHMNETTRSTFSALNVTHHFVKHWIIAPSLSEYIATLVKKIIWIYIMFYAMTYNKSWLENSDRFLSQFFKLNIYFF